MNKIVILLLSVICLQGCTEKKPADKIQADSKTVGRKTIDDYNRHLFSLKIIDFKRVMDSIGIYSDTSFVDTAEYFRRPKATVYANTVTGTMNQVFENPKGSITLLTYYRDGKQIYVAEYFPNGQVMCSFLVTPEGVRDGPYECYNEDGSLRGKGYYKMGVESK